MLGDIGEPSARVGDRLRHDTPTFGGHRHASRPVTSVRCR